MSIDSNSHTISETLCRLSSHLDMLAGQIFDVEEALGCLLDQGNGADALPISRFQALDFARQSLEDCALLLHFLGNEKALALLSTNTAQLEQNLKLASTRRLAGRELETSVNSENGEVDFL